MLESYRKEIFCSSVLVPMMDTVPLDDGTEGEQNHDAEENIHKCQVMSHYTKR